MAEPMPGGRTLDVITVGRAAVDLYGEQVGGRLEDMATFAKYLGGCPANIAVGAARLGLRTAMITRVGDEHMGRFVREALAAEGVDVSHVATDPDRPTGLVILGIRDENTFPLIFYRENCADMALAEADMDAGFIASARALVVTGTHFSTPSTDAACRAAIRHARAVGTKVVLDIDYRPVLWGLTGRGRGEDRFVASADVSAHLQSIAPLCDLIVGTEEEFHIAGGSTDTLTALSRLRALSQAVFVVKRGADGCVVLPGAVPARLEDGIVGAGFPVEVFNVLGAGDGFMSGLLRGWLRGADWPEACRIANACGALVVSRHGCAPAMPSWTELSDFLERVGQAGNAPRALHDDPRVAHLHRVTTGRRAWPEVRALAFDRPTEFEDMARRHGVGVGRIKAFKSLVAKAIHRVAGDIPGAGSIVDDRLDRAPMHALTGQGLWLARPLEFGQGPGVFAALRTWPVEHIAKASFSVRPDAASMTLQLDRLAVLGRACANTGHELLLQLDRSDSAEAVAEAMEELAAAGVRPDWWSVPPLPDATAWRRVGSFVRRQDSHCRGIVLAAQDVGEDGLGQVFSAIGDEAAVGGFIVALPAFRQPAEAWFAGYLGDGDAIAAIADKYRRISQLWQASRRH